MPRRRGLLRTAARAAVIAGTATSVSRRVARRHEKLAAGEVNALGPVDGGSSPVVVNDLVGSLQRLAELKAAGALSAQEYTAAKAKLLAV